ncbi:MAG: hypothetical protein Q9184_008081, partial [Pyrenodesmia sp. 2 TL-2023]
MSSGKGRSVSDVLSELEHIIELRKALEVKAEKHTLFPSDWVDHHLTKKIQELELAVPTTRAQGFRYLTRMLRIHDHLMDRELLDLANQLTMVIYDQKSALDGNDSPGGTVRPASPILRMMLSGILSQSPKILDPTTTPMMSGALPYVKGQSSGGMAGSAAVKDNVQEGYYIKAISTGKHKLSVTDDLRLVWREDTKDLQCYQGSHNLSIIYPGFNLRPDTVKVFSYSKDS